MNILSHCISRGVFGCLHGIFPYLIVNTRHMYAPIFKEKHTLFQISKYCIIPNNHAGCRYAAGGVLIMLTKIIDYFNLCVNVYPFFHPRLYLSGLNVSPARYNLGCKCSDQSLKPACGLFRHTAHAHIM